MVRNVYVSGVCAVLACLLFSSCCAAGMLVQSSALELEAMSLELSAGGFALRGKAANGYNNIT